MNRCAETTGRHLFATICAWIQTPAFLFAAIIAPVYPVAATTHPFLDGPALRIPVAIGGVALLASTWPTVGLRISRRLRAWSIAATVGMAVAFYFGQTGYPGLSRLSILPILLLLVVGIVQGPVLSLLRGPRRPAG